MNINWLIDSALGQVQRADPDSPVIGMEGKPSWSRREFAARRDFYVRVLSALDLAAGDRVAILMHNEPDYVALYFAIARIGAVAVRVNFRLAPAEIAFVLNDSRSRLAIYGQDLESAIDAARHDVRTCVYVRIGADEADMPEWARSSSTLAEQAVDVSIPNVLGRDSLTIMYTSGTTGMPKGSLWTHDNAMWFFASEAIGFGFGPDTVTLTTGPLYHAGSLECHLLPTLLAGGRGLFLGSGSFDIGRVLDVCESEGVTDVLLFPHALYELLRVEKDELQARLTTLKAITSGGDMIMPWALQALEDKLPGVRFDQGYGLTEGGGVIAILEDRYRRGQEGTVGRPLPMSDVRVVARDGLPVGPGERGEVVVRGPNVSNGYWNRPAANAETYREGWCHTGDEGMYSEAGFLTITGRIKDMIRSGGENVYPAEIEAVITEHPAVLDAAVVGVPDERFLEVGCAVIVMAAGATVTDDELIEYCRGRLARYKCPKHIFRVDSLPRTPSGKLRKNVLRDQYSELVTASWRAE